MFSLMGDGPSPGGISARLRMGVVLIPGDSRGRASIYTNIDGTPGGFSGNAEGAEIAESAGICAIFRGILRAVGTFLRPILPVFYQVSA